MHDQVRSILPLVPYVQYRYQAFLGINQFLEHGVNVTRITDATDGKVIGRLRAGV